MKLIEHKGLPSSYFFIILQVDITSILAKLRVTYKNVTKQSDKLSKRRVLGNMISLTLAKQSLKIRHYSTVIRLLVVLSLLYLFLHMYPLFGLLWTQVSSRHLFDLFVNVCFSAFSFCRFHSIYIRSCALYIKCTCICIRVHVHM